MLRPGTVVHHDQHVVQTRLGDPELPHRAVPRGGDERRPSSHALTRSTRSGGRGHVVPRRIDPAIEPGSVVEEDPSVGRAAVRPSREASGGRAAAYAVDLEKGDGATQLARFTLGTYGRVDILVNNAGRSIRRSVKLSYDRFHDFERTMQLNYFGALKLILAFLPGMRERKSGQIINVSSIGVQTNTPRFSAYVASKAALDAFSRCVAPECVGDNVKFTTVYMPLVRTPMIAPTDIYKAFPTLTPDEAAQMLTDAMIDKPKRLASRLGTFGEVVHAVSPKSVDIVLNTAYNLFPDSAAAKAKTDGKPAPADEKKGSEEMSTEAVAMAYLLRGVHF